MPGLPNPRLYGTNNNAGSIRENAKVGSKHRTIWRESKERVSSFV